MMQVDSARVGLGIRKQGENQWSSEIPAEQAKPSGTGQGHRPLDHVLVHTHFALAHLRTAEWGDNSCACSPTQFILVIGL